jgi:hypothetical protein
MRFISFPVLLTIAACSPTPPSAPRVYPEGEAPLELTPYVERADGALLVLRTRLLETLTTELSRGGPAGAVEVCRDVAQSVTDTASREQGVDSGRTSHRLRNPANAPRTWAREIVASHAGTKAEDAGSYVADLGDRVGVLRPIGAIEMCTSCHGTDEALDPLAREKIAAAYPGDEATGFAVGDLRGWMWAEVPR